MAIIFLTKKRKPLSARDANHWIENLFKPNVCLKFWKFQTLMSNQSFVYSAPDITNERNVARVTVDEGQNNPFSTKVQNTPYPMLL